jgi:hypothetical protein
MDNVAVRLLALFASRCIQLLHELGLAGGSSERRRSPTAR